MLQVALTTFTQLFTILAMKEENRRNPAGPRETVSFPRVYALLASKESTQYASILRTVVDVVDMNTEFLIVERRALCPIPNSLLQIPVLKFSPREAFLVFLSSRSIYLSESTSRGFASSILRSISPNQIS